jgi:hypothetical protein
MEARLTPRRLVPCALAIVTIAAVTSACGGGSDVRAAKEPPLQRYSDRHVSFSYPAAWTESAPKGAGELHFQPLVYLSTEPVQNACSTKGNGTSCGWPIKRLSPGGVIALWQIPYMPPSSTPRGKRIQVGGRPAWRQDTAGGGCRRIGADQTIEVSMPANSLELIVCLRGPGLAQEEKSVRAMLASTKFTSQ